MNTAAKQASVWLIILIAGGAMIVATFGEYVIGVLGPVFDKELGISTSMIGVLTAIMFGTSGVVSFFIGPLVDRVAPPLIAGACIFLSGIVLVTFAFVQALPSLVVGCVLVGAVMALANPLSNRLISHYLPPHTHANAISWKSLGPQLGALLAGFIFGSAEIIDWRLMVVSISIIMLLFGVYSYFALRHKVFYRAMSMEPLPADAEKRLDDGVIEEDEKTKPIAWWLIAWSFFFGGAVSSVGAYIPAYASSEMGMTLAIAGIAGSLVAAVSVVSRFIWVALLRFMDFVTALVLAGVLSALAAVVLALAPQLGAPVFWVAIVLVGATALGASPVTQIVLVGATSRKQIGFVSAMNGVGLYAGFTFQPLAIGWLIDNVAFDLGWYFMAGSAFVAALVIIAYALVHGKPKGAHIVKPKPEKAHATAS